MRDDVIEAVVIGLIMGVFLSTVLFGLWFQGVI